MMPLLGQKSLDNLLSISPSRFVAAGKCVLREVLAANHTAPMLPISPASAVGSITHLLLQEAGEGRLADRELAAERRWNQLVDDLEHKMSADGFQRWLLPITKALPDYEVRKIRTLRRAQALKVLPKATRGPVSEGQDPFGFELQVATSDGLVRGRIDRVLKSPGGPIIQDFKTGNVYDARENVQRIVRQDYEVQMQLYAALYFEVFGVWAARLELIPLSGTAIPIAFTREGALGLVKEAKRSLRKINTELTICRAVQDCSSLAAPQASVCGFCAFRPSCASYRERLNVEVHLNDVQWPDDVMGQVTEQRQLGNGTIALAIRQAGVDIWIRGLNPNAERHPALGTLKAGDSIGVFNLRVPRNGGAPTESAYTTIYRDS